MSLRFLLPALFLTALCVRAVTLDLPVQGEAARLAAAGARLADGGGIEAGGRGPLVPLLVAGAVGLGVPATLALRWIDVCAACLVPLLVLLLASRLGLAPGRARLASLLLALHPLGVLGPGGVDPGTAAVVGALTMAGLLLLAADRVGVRRWSLVPLGLLLFADGSGLLLGVPLVVLFVRREPGPRIQTAVALLAAGAVAGGLTTWFGATAAPSPTAALLWLAAAPLGVFLPGVPTGLRRLATSPVGLAWLAAVVVGALGLAVGAPFPVWVALPLILLGGLEGSSALWKRHARRVGAFATFASAIATLLWVSGGLQAALAPQGPAVAGRLHLLRQAMRVAADAAGERGWIVLAVAEGHPEDQASLADLHPEHWTWAGRETEADAAAVRRLRVFPAAALEAGQGVAIVARAGATGAIETFGGAAIYHQVLVRRIGPYVVLRAQRP